MAEWGEVTYRSIVNLLARLPHAAALGFSNILLKMIVPSESRNLFTCEFFNDIQIFEKEKRCE